MEISDFDYQSKVWGSTVTKLSPKYLAYLRLKYTLDDLKLVKGKVLDAGCGGGGFIKSIKHYRPDLKLWGVDLSQKAIKAASDTPEGVAFKVGDIYQLPFRSNYFEAVILEDVLEHLVGPKKAIAEIGRVLKKGGVFSANIPLEGSLASVHFFLERLGWKAKERLAGHIQKFTKSGVDKMLEDAGFEVVESRYLVHPIGQIIDVGFFSCLGIINKKLDVGLEEKLGNSTLARIKAVMATIINTESRLLFRFPGAGVHIRAVK